MSIVAGIFCILIGVYCVICCAKDIDWFFNTRRMKRVVALVGRTAARAIYFALGIILIIGSIIVMCNQGIAA